MTRIFFFSTPTLNLGPTVTLRVRSPAIRTLALGFTAFAATAAAGDEPTEAQEGQDTKDDHQDHDRDGVPRVVVLADGDLLVLRRVLHLVVELGVLGGELVVHVAHHGVGDGLFQLADGGAGQVRVHRDAVQGPIHGLIDVGADVGQEGGADGLVDRLVHSVAEDDSQVVFEVVEKGRVEFLADGFVDRVVDRHAQCRHD